MASLNYEKVPVPHMAGAVQRYIEHGIMPGDFLTAIICNDLIEACGRADENNQRAIFEWVAWFHNEAPRRCWGSRDAFETWSVQFIAKQTG